MKKEFKKGDIVYLNGIWKAEIVEDYGDSVCYKPFEGVSDDRIGENLTASKGAYNFSLIKIKN